MKTKVFMNQIKMKAVFINIYGNSDKEVSKGFNDKGYTFFDDTHPMLAQKYIEKFREAGFQVRTIDYLKDPVTEVKDKKSLSVLVDLGVVKNEMKIEYEKYLKAEDEFISEVCGD